jgi:uncharacterized protein (DUF1015 family)
MATIRPFRAIHPNPFYADQLVFTTPQAESVAGDTASPQGMPPLKTLLESGARQRPETPEGQAQAYNDINETLTTLLESERLYADQSPAIYIYEIEHDSYRQTGIWALTNLNEDIKTHERTFDDSVRRIKNFRQNTGLEGNPILLAYEPNGIIDGIIAVTKRDHPGTRYTSPSGLHKLWKIEDPERIQLLVDAFAGIGRVYLADGHHRRDSAEALMKEQIKNGQPVFDTISALYMSTDELRIQQYNRVFIPELPINKEWLFKALLSHFYLQDTFNNSPVQPKEERRMGLYIEGVWFHMVAKPHTYSLLLTGDKLDVSILQNRVLKPLFGVLDPGTDKRLKHIGGGKAIAEMEAVFKANPYAIGFTLCPMTIVQLTGAADEGINLPPKSTWIDPKVPYGLLLHRHNIK